MKPTSAITANLVVPRLWRVADDVVHRPTSNHSMRGRPQAAGPARRGARSPHRARRTRAAPAACRRPAAGSRSQGRMFGASLPDENAASHIALRARLRPANGVRWGAAPDSPVRLRTQRSADGELKLASTRRWRTARPERPTRSQLPPCFRRYGGRARAHDPCSGSASGEGRARGLAISRSRRECVRGGAQPAVQGGVPSGRAAPPGTRPLPVISPVPLSSGRTCRTSHAGL